MRETLATLDTSFWIAFHMLFCATSVDVRMISQQLLDVEALVTRSTHVLLVEVEVEVASDAGE